MVKYSASEADSTLDLTFQALADPTRRAILGRLAEGEAPAVSKHLKVLEKAGFLIRARDGRVHRCNLDAGPMQAASDWISTYRNFWEGQLGSLARYLETEQKKKKEEDKKNEPSSND